MIDLDALLSDLEELVSCESPSADRAALERCASLLATVIERRLGSRPRLVEGPAGPHVHWSAGAGGRVLILGHYDTVHPLGSLARRPFRVADGRVSGPGVFDMKAGIVQAIHAIAALDEPDGVELLLTCDEEVGSRTSRALVEERAQRCAAVLVCEPSADGGALKTARKGVGTFTVTVSGRAAHAGLEPEKGVNSLVAAAEVITAIAGFGDPPKGTTVTPTMATAGTADNVVPAETTVLVDVRAEHPDEQRRVEAAMASLRTSVPEAAIELRGGFNRPPMHPSASERLFPLAQRAAASIGQSVTGVAVGGGSDGNFTAAVGTPTLDGLGAVGGGAHADHEYVLVDTLVPRTALLCAVVAEILGGSAAPVR